MKYRLLQLLGLLLLTVTLLNCEKDDICADGNANTPFMVIEFYDSVEVNTLKNVTNLGVGAPTFTTRFSFTGTNRIEVPLRTNSTLTTLNFIKNGGDTTNLTDDNPDAITFNYSTRDVYLSRACGFKTVFQLDAVTPFVYTPDGDAWIQNIMITQPNIENENEVHVKIYF